MRPQRVATVMLALALAWTATVAAQETADELYQAGLYQEEVQGDLQRAITIYQRVLSEHASNRVVAAKAQLHVGICYETLGLQEAQQAYQRVVANYGDQSDVVRQARARLAALSQHVAAIPASGGPVARMLLTSVDSADLVIDNPYMIVPSPDGRRVAYAQTEREDAGVYVRDLASGEIQRVATREPTLNGNNFSVVWSSDGRRLAFQQTDGETQATAIRIFDLTARATVAIPGLNARGLYLLDWSRDGRHILCNHLERNTLELVTVADGTMTALSDGIWMGSRASLSPDGRFVAYAAGENGKESLYTMPLAGGPRTRIADARGGVHLHPLWSPDGKAIAYWHPDGIWLVPVTDGVASGAPVPAYRTDTPKMSIAWTEAGGLYFTFLSERSSAYQVAVDPASGRFHDTRVRELPDYPAIATREAGGGFAWSPDMQSVVGWRGNGIRVYAADTRTTTSYDLGTDPAYRVWWSPDGREVIYYTGDPSSWIGQLKAVDVGTGQIRAISPSIQGFVSSLSADTRRMAVMRRLSAPRAFELVVAETGQPDGQVVTSGPDSDGSRRLASWWAEMSPRGDEVLLVLLGDAGQPGSAQDVRILWLVASDGGDARRIATAPAINSTIWDPSGQYIAYTARGDDTTSVLHVVEAATGVERDRLMLSSSDQRWGITDWSPDGRSIGIVRTQGFWEYWVVQGLLDAER
jgi:Tol biopolymer transport system component